MEIKSIKNGSGGNCYTVQNEDTTILLECGIKYKDIVWNAYANTGVVLSDFNACVVSHEHSDHCKAIREVSKRMKVYANSSVIKKHGIKNSITVNDLKPFTIGSIKLLPIPVNHGETPCMAYVLKDKDSLKLFATDFSICKYSLSNIKFDELWIECNYVNERIGKNELEEFKFQRQINTHMSVNNLVTHLERMDLTKCKQINLIHLSKFYSDKDIIRQKLSKFNIPIEFAHGGY